MHAFIHQQTGREDPERTRRTRRRKRGSLLPWRWERGHRSAHGCRTVCKWWQVHVQVKEKEPSNVDEGSWEEEMPELRDAE